jgi:hypothetical protein
MWETWFNMIWTGPSGSPCEHSRQPSDHFEGRELLNQPSLLKFSKSNLIYDVGLFLWKTVLLNSTFVCHVCIPMAIHSITFEDDNSGLTLHNNKHSNDKWIV